MRTGFALAENAETMPKPAEQALIKETIRDPLVKSVGEWLIQQKPKLRAKFNMFLEEVINSPINDEDPGASQNVAERIAKDILQHKFHPVIRHILENDVGQYSDTLNILSNYLARSNVMASIPAVRDPTPKLLKAIAQEDHLFQGSRTVKHDMPKPKCAGVVTRKVRNQMNSFEVTANTRARSCKPTSQHKSPFAQFPGGTGMETTYQETFHKYDEDARPKRNSVFNVFNSPTCI